MNLGTAQVIRADARHLPLADDSVDLIVTSPPYFGLRSYTDGGEHYDGQIGAEASPQEFLDALHQVTLECIRVLKPTGSLWVNLGDKYADRAGPTWRGSSDRLMGRPAKPRRASSTSMAPRKSVLGLPWRYALRCVDELGLILRAEVVWSKPNGIPESVTDRVKRSHEQWFHFTREPRYFAALDEIREPYIQPMHKLNLEHPSWANRNGQSQVPDDWEGNPLGKLPGSVWTVPTEPLNIPDHVVHAACCGGRRNPACQDGVDHFAAFPTAWPRKLIPAFSPAAICTACGEGRRPVSTKTTMPDAQGRTGRHGGPRADAALAGPARAMLNGHAVRTIIGYACACDDASAETTPAVVLDPFGGTGTTAMVAKALGRTGISVDLSADYCRLAEWRTNDRDQLAKVLEIPKQGPADPEQLDMLALIEAGA